MNKMAELEINDSIERRLMRVCRELGAMASNPGHPELLEESICELLKEGLGAREVSFDASPDPAPSSLSLPLYDERQEVAMFLTLKGTTSQLLRQRSLSEELAESVSWVLGRTAPPHSHPHKCSRCALAYAGKALIATDLRGNITCFSPAAERLYRVPAEQARGSHISRYCPPELKQAQQEMLDGLVANGQPIQLDTFRLTHDGRRVPVELNLSLRPDRQGRPVGFLGVLSDISERKTNERILLGVQEGLEAATGQEFFQNLVSRLGQMLEVAFVLVTRFDESDEASTLATWVRGELAENFQYRLPGSPCEHVRELQTTCFFPRKVQECFPEDTELVELGIESYLGTPLRGPDGKVLGLLVAMDDKPMQGTPIRRHALEMFANRAAAELNRHNSMAALRQSEVRFRALMEQSPAPTAIFNRSGEFFNTNTAWSELLGTLGLDDLGLLDEFEKALSGETVLPSERHVELEDSSRLIKPKLYPLFDTTGEILHVVVVVEDLTSSRESMEQIRGLSERLALALKAGSFGVWDFDIANQSVVWDERMYEIYQLAPDSTDNLLETWRAAVHPDDKSRDQRVWEFTMQKDLPLDYVMRIVRPDGETRHVRVNGVVLRDKDDKPYRVTGLSVDVTNWSTAQQEREELQDQLNQAQRMESLGRLAGGVAHDFNNMLSVIIGNTELALSCLPPESDLKDELLEIKEAARRSAALTKQLLFFARKQDIDPKALQVNPVIENLLKMLERIAGEQITILWQPGNDLWQIKADPNQLDQVLMNLCINAKDAMGGPGQIYIATRNVELTQHDIAGHPESTPGDYVEISVRDTGVGMDEETKKRIFEPFFTTKKLNKGTGLGMSTVYGIVQRHGGLIKVESREGAGTTIRVLLPQFEGQCTAQEGRKSKPNGGAETVLLVEDQQSVLRIARRMLQNLGYQVLAVTNPQQALEMVEHESPKIHLLLTDVIMPDMNGAELAESLLKKLPEMKCMFMSGYTADFMAEQGVKESGPNFICKPFTQSELAGKVRRALEAKV